VREEDLAVRLSGDEFAVLATDLAGPEEVHAVAARIQEVLHPSFLVESVTLDVEASIGIEVYDPGRVEDGEQPVLHDQPKVGLDGQRLMGSRRCFGGLTPPVARSCRRSSSRSPRAPA
jgi:hypothetical protein